MNTPLARQSAAPPARPLIGLTLAVVLVHGLLLQAAPAHWSASPDALGTPLRPLLTRTIELKPPPAPSPNPTAIAAAPARQKARALARISETKTAKAPVSTEPTAIETIATEATPVAADATRPSPATDPAPPVVAAAEPAPPAPAAVSQALTIPGSVRLKYAMTGRSKNLDYNAFAELDWLHDGQSYQARMVVSALFLGTRSMTSSGRITGDGLAPTRFLDKSRSERAAHFEAERGKIVFSANTPDAPWLRGAQDRLSVFLQLGSLLAGDPGKYPPDSTLSLYTVGPREADTWTFAVGAAENLQLPAGDIAAIKLTRKPVRDYDQMVEIWFAPAMAYLPVRSRITQRNGDFVDQQLRGTEKP